MEWGRRKTLAIWIAGMAAGYAQLSWGQEDITELRQQIEELDQKVRVLERLREVDQEAASAKAKETPSLSVGSNGFVLRSADSAYQLRLGGNIQLDSRWYPDKETPIGGTANAFLMRKVRPILEGVLAEKFAFRIMSDFGGGQSTLQDAYIEYRAAKPVNIRAGKYKPPIGLERLQADAETEFVERGLPTNLVPNRDIGIQLGGSVLADTVSYQFGVFNGNIDNSIVDTDTNDEKDYLGRVFLEPFRNGESLFRGLGVGIAYAYGVQQGTAATGASNLPQYRTVGQQVFFSFASGAFADGARTRLSPQFYWFAGPLGLLGEYVTGKQEVTRSTNAKRDVDVTAWQLAGFWVVTGEDASFRNPTPRRAFNPSEGVWGAVELVARYGVQSIDEDVFVGTGATALADPTLSAQEARSAGIGVNWYFSRNFKIQANYDRTAFDLGATGGADRPAENAIFTRFQANF